MLSSDPHPVLAAEIDRLFATLREDAISVSTKLADLVQHRITAAAQVESTSSRLGETIVVQTLNLLTDLLIAIPATEDGQ